MLLTKKKHCFAFSLQTQLNSHLAEFFSIRLTFTDIAQGEEAPSQRRVFGEQLNKSNWLTEFGRAGLFFIYFATEGPLFGRSILVPPE